MPVTAATNANVMMAESLTGHSSRYQNGEKASSFAPCLPCRAHSLAGRSARRETAALESHFDHPANALIPALRETANPTMYVTQLPVASTHPKYMS
jgi:hypothetical protein